MTFHTACDEADYAAAERLLNTLCKHTVQPSTLPSDKDRRLPEDLSGACERLANLLLWRAEANTGKTRAAEADQAEDADEEGHS